MAATLASVGEVGAVNEYPVSATHWAWYVLVNKYLNWADVHEAIAAVGVGVGAVVGSGVGAAVVGSGAAVVGAGVSASH